MCDKLPVRTILELHGLAFLVDPPEYSCPDDLKHLDNKTRRKRKTTKNMKGQTRLYKKNKDKMLRCRYRYRNPPDYLNLLYVIKPNELNLLQRL